MQEYSPQDFLRLIEHRIRKEIRQGDLISFKKSYVLEESKSLESQVLLHFLKQIFHERLDLSGGEVIVADFLELFISKRLDVFLSKENSEILFNKTITPLRSITQHELKEVAKLLSIEGELTPINQEVINTLQEKYPQSKPSFLKSFANIEKLTKK